MTLIANCSRAAPSLEGHYRAAGRWSVGTDSCQARAGEHSHLLRTLNFRLDFKTADATLRLELELELELEPELDSDSGSKLSSLAASQPQKDGSREN